MLEDFPNFTNHAERKIVLHSCCAPCSAAILEWLLGNEIRPLIFYFNPNIFPLEEYNLRKSENQRYAASLGLDFVDDDYDHVTWRNAMKGLENEPERGLRCAACFTYRLMETAKFAKKCGIEIFTTTLSSSRHKSFNQIVDAALKAETTHLGTQFWAKNWRKGDLPKRAAEISKINCFYRQNYCGCSG